ncbi:MAG: di-heme oxidoredictase family protein, partial [Phycisphaerae bacterium]
TLSDAILAHGGEGQASRDAFAALSDSEQEDVIEFMLSLGGRDQFSVGLVPPNTPIADVGTFGGPTRALDSDESAQFLRGRTLYDTEFGHATGAGGLEGMDGGIRFNGDSCRACHFQPVLGGAGPRDVNVIRHGMVTEDGTFVNPLETPNSILHSQSRVESPIPMPEGDTTFLGHRQTPHTLGLGLIGAIPDETIMANADPDDLDGDGISGRAHVLSDGRLGKYGWKADVPSIAEFVRDAMAAEIGLTVEAQDGLTFGITVDNDGVADPELLASEAEDLAFFLEMLGGPPRQAAIDEAAAADGEALFESVGCASCHIPVLTGSAGDAALYSDLLLHEILPEGQVSATSDQATEREFRTAPLWGLSQTAPYMHSGLADTIEEAILLHDGEAVGVRDAFEALSDEDKANLLAFLDTL